MRRVIDDVLPVPWLDAVPGEFASIRCIIKGECSGLAVTLLMCSDPLLSKSDIEGEVNMNPSLISSNSPNLCDNVPNRLPCAVSGLPLTNSGVWLNLVPPNGFDID